MSARVSVVSAARHWEHCFSTASPGLSEVGERLSACVRGRLVVHNNNNNNGVGCSISLQPSIKITLSLYDHDMIDALFSKHLQLIVQWMDLYPVMVAVCFD